MAKKQKSVANVETTGALTIGSSDVIRWDDVMTVQGYDIKVSKAVELGLKYGAWPAEMLKKDLKSKKGLLITFPIAMLMSNLQERLEKVEGLTRTKAGEELLNRVKA